MCILMNKWNTTNLVYKVVCTLMFMSVIVFFVITITADYGGNIKIIRKAIFFDEPKQIHLSFGDSTTDIVVTWSTIILIKNAFVEFGLENLTFRQKPNQEPYMFVDGGVFRRKQFIYRVTLSNLLPNTSYIYRCGCEDNWSKIYNFHTPPNATTNWVPSLAIFGDLGLINGMIYSQLVNDTREQMYDAIIHNGDIAYDMSSQNGVVGDLFLTRMEAVAAYVPYMTTAGNHERSYNYSHYRARFSMPGDTENFCYSFNLGPVHFIGFSTEVYYYPLNQYLLIAEQYNWIENDLQEANKPENRAIRPWIVTFAHRPIYCSSAYYANCIDLENGLDGLEELLYRYGVDVELWAHLHFYERLWPTYKKKVYNGSLQEPYRNPGAPVHITSGAAGNEEGNEHFTEKVPAWSAFRNRDYSFTRMKAYNHTHLYFAQISEANKIIDNFWLIKDRHGSYEELKNGA